ncbi:MAG TPA: HesA/MoeB/ThiF family protein [Pseudoxanthomonas sp.]
MQDAQLLRYSRHILLDDIGVEGQQQFAAAHVLVVGAGGLGSPAALYLAASGVGKLTLIDDDVVDLTNLQRQILHTHHRIGRNKAESGKETLSALNPEIEIIALAERADAARLRALVATCSVVLDCSDNYATRQAVNAACVAAAVPLVAGALDRFAGQLMVFDPRDAASPCYACVFAPGAPVEEVACATMGVFAPLAGVIGAMQAGEALKLIAGITPSLAGRLVMFDARTMAMETIGLGRQPDCPVCAARK